ncbi:MAG: hypothetical protein MUC28_02905, partial [Planctomycetes bacterium]|nr:hypothetical protein [Planctomycetota bacterium]
MKKIILLAIVLAITLAGCALAGGGEKQVAIGVEAAKAKAADFINNNLLQPGTEATVKEVSEEAGLYKLIVTLSSGQEITSYLSQDGKKFFPNVYDIAEIEKQAEAKDAEGEAAEAGSLSDIPKKDKAMAELYVMAFCPY